ncbi:archaemetzincin [Ferruginibacter albus]|uniref:archaemetzincin n=1 Tax=Ferruginibacter albus TaxID=2875540 RepID=UPI001CC5B6FD|nr:archaemetzincin [Ferruginibacter albus]UAY53558.1 archaemetzincin [Ferruginibacter albus]
MSIKKLYSIYLPLLFLFISCTKHKKQSGNINIEQDSLIRSNSSYFNAIEQNDVTLSSPKPGDWLYEHPEKGQSFEQYKDETPTKLSPEKSIIYLQPIGHFTNLQLSALQLTKEYVEIFFQLKTILLTPISDSIIPKTVRRNRFNHEQLLSTYIIDSVLKNRIPQNGFLEMAFTEKDLYPANDWNYVFGQASYADKVGVTSIYRLQNEVLTKENFSACLRRLMNIATHEIGHMFSVQHCTFAKCVMNGANSLTETDQSPNRLCSECQKKLFWNIRYGNKKRLKEIAYFMKRNDLQKDYDLIHLDEENISP